MEGQIFLAVKRARPARPTRPARPRQTDGLFLMDTIAKLNETHVTLDMLQDAKGEGIYFYIQTTNCRRLVLRMVFQNAPLGRLILISFFDRMLTSPERC